MVKKTKNYPIESNSVCPHIYSLIGDFGSGKTTILKILEKNTNYGIGSEFYDYVLKTGKYEAHNTNMTTSEVFEINKFRDKLALSSGKRVVVLDQDALSFPAYELARKVHKKSSSYGSCVKQLMNYRALNPLTAPSGYVFFKVNVKERMDRILLRTKYERPTAEFFNNLLTQAAYRSFYESLLEKIEPFYYLVIDTTNMTPYDVFKDIQYFIEKLEADYKYPPDISEHIFPSQQTLIKRVSDIYEKDLKVLEFSKDIKYD
jgi:cytidylate kinase